MIKNNEGLIYVFLGRFSPLHKGHQMIIDRMVAKHGSENCLIIIGSKTSLNNKTPYTYRLRKKMIGTVYPDLTITGIADIDPREKKFKKNTVEKWLKNLKKIETLSGKKFVFYGGSKKDVEYLQKYFLTIILDRKTVGMNISATKIRRLLLQNNKKEILKYLDIKITDMATINFRKFQ